MSRDEFKLVDMYKICDTSVLSMLEIKNSGHEQSGHVVRCEGDCSALASVRFQ